MKQSRGMTVAEMYDGKVVELAEARARIAELESELEQKREWNKTADIRPWRSERVFVVNYTGFIDIRMGITVIEDAEVYPFWLPMSALPAPPKE